MSPEGQGAIVMTLEPVWVALLGVFVMDEMLSVASVSGMAIIFLALIVNSIGTVRSARQAKKARLAAELDSQV